MEDISNGAITWCLVKALQDATEEQKNMIKVECINLIEEKENEGYMIFFSSSLFDDHPIWIS